MVTILDVAARAGVGVGTVSRAINHSPQVTEPTRRKVMAAVEELNYLPNPSARALKRGRTSRIAVVVPFLTQPAAVERLSGLASATRATPYHLVLFAVETPEERDEYYRSLAVQHQADGVVAVSLRPRDKEIDAFQQAGVPLVLLDSDHPRVSHAVTDDVEGGRLATRHLLGLGHRRIAFVGDLTENPFGFTSSARRCDGYRRALGDAGIHPDPALIRTGPHGRDTASRLTMELLDLEDPPTAIFAASDTQALGVLQAARERGIRVPQELSVIGFDDIEVAGYVGLTTVNQPLEASGVIAGELLFDALADGESPPAAQRLPLEVVPRETTGPAPRDAR
ncbi:MAG TPA: LacI family DNA-binding transcriptional regulator [Egibacteraceae bacterium]|nr:LacI family DNA-binding transcriptional regulator [Egibacteraceae bacterium]